jgi:hypothetical protein
MIVLFQGFKSFNRTSDYWSHQNLSWGFTLAGYSVIGGFIVLLFISRLSPVAGPDAFRFPQLDVADYVAGMAPPAEDLPREKSQWKRAYNAVLDFI